MSERAGIMLARSSDQPRVPDGRDVADRGSSYFTDGRAGVDRWGREHADLVMCGEGWDGHLCPAHLESSCPGERNRGDRIEGNVKRVCLLDCGSCGGSGRSNAMAFCGQAKGAPMAEAAFAESGGSLRLDKWTAPTAAGAMAWPHPYVPALESYGGGWRLNDLPAVMTTMQTARAPWRPSSQGVRGRLHGFEGRLGVSGYVKDDLLDECWDDLPATLRYLRRSEVDVFVGWQISSYSTEPHLASLANLNRTCELYLRALDAGFPCVVFDFPPLTPDWMREDLIDFCVRSRIPAIALGLQIMSTGGGLDGRIVRTMRRLHTELNPGVEVMIFGVGDLTAMIQIAQTFRGRRLAFSGKEPYAQTIFQQLMPQGAPAPKRMDRPATFHHNVRVASRQIERVLAKR